MSGSLASDSGCRYIPGDVLDLLDGVTSELDAITCGDYDQSRSEVIVRRQIMHDIDQLRTMKDEVLTTIKKRQEDCGNYPDLHLQDAVHRTLGKLRNMLYHCIARAEDGVEAVPLSFERPDPLHDDGFWDPNGSDTGCLASAVLSLCRRAKTGTVKSGKGIRTTKSGKKSRMIKTRAITTLQTITDTIAIIHNAFRHPDDHRCYAEIMTAELTELESAVSKYVSAAGLSMSEKELWEEHAATAQQSDDESLAEEFSACAKSASDMATSNQHAADELNRYCTLLRNSLCAQAELQGE